VAGHGWQERGLDSWAINVTIRNVI